MLKTITSVANTVGSLEYKGLWNAATNTPTLVSSVGTQGDYYVVSVAGTTNLDGVTTWDEGDWAIFNGSVWQLFQGGQDGVFATLTVSGEIIANGGIALGDNDKATFGASDDLQIYHDGSNSRIYDTGTGDLRIQGTNLRLMDANGANYLYAVQGSDVTLYHNNSAKLSTTATGIDISGTATMDGLTVIGSDNSTQAIFSGSTGGSGRGLRIATEVVASTNEGVILDAQSTTGYASIALQTASTDRLNIASNGNISFYEDTGTTPKFVWDASDESLIIGSGVNTYAKLTIAEEGTSVGSTIRLVGTNTAAGASQVSHITSYQPAGGFAADTALDFKVRGGADTFAAPSTVMTLLGGGNVGIGAIPRSILEISDSAPELRITDERDTTLSIGDIVASLGFYSNDTSGASGGANNLPRGAIDLVTNNAFNSNHSLVFRTRGDEAATASEKMRIDASGAVIVNNGGAGNGIIRINGATGSTEAVIFQRGGTEASRIGHANSADLAFYTGSGATERARLTGDGNFLVGTTSYQGGGGSGAKGFYVGSDGLLSSARSNATVAVLNRTTSDGDIVEFRKDGTTVGSIGTVGGELYIESGDVGLQFNASGNNIVPYANGFQDAVTSIGASGNRFKDLYLSGGVYLGGTGAANKLDDYETGTWTPAASSYDGTMTVTSATYVKVGKLVTVKANVSFDATADGSGVNISGLPFTTTGTAKANGGFVTSSTVSSAVRIQAVGTGSFFLLTTDNTNVTYTTMASTTLEFIMIYEAA
jgi:hypothetical protein